MNLIKKLISNAALKEDAAGGAVGGGAVAAFAMPLFSKLTARELPKKIRIQKVKKEKKEKKGLGLKEGFYAMHEDASQIGGDTFDNTEVVAKLKSLENKETVNKYETQAFALEDEQGNIVKVRVRSEQGPGFEAALNAFLSDLDDDTGTQRNIPEIAELLFKLKDRFDIVDVEWPDVPEDQEEGVELAGGEGGAEGAEGGELDLGGAEGAEGELDLGGGDLGGGEEDVKGLLTQVIDMMKADAEARKAEAHARAAEAKAKETSLATQQVYAKVKQEEQILDMEAQEKRQKEAEREAKRLAKLAKWKHDMEREEGASFDQTPEMGEMGLDQMAGGREEEETLRRPAPTQAQPGQKRLSGRVAPTDVAKFILSRVK